MFLYVDIYVLYGDLPNAFCSLRRGGSPYFSCLTFQDSVFSNTQQSSSVCEKCKMNILWKKCSKNSAWGCLDLTVYENHSWGGSSMLRKFSVESTFLINTIFCCQNIWQEVVSCLHVSGFSFLSLTLCTISWFLDLPVAHMLATCHCSSSDLTAAGCHQKRRCSSLLPFCPRKNFILLDIRSSTLCHWQGVSSANIFGWGEKRVFHWSSSLNWFSPRPLDHYFQMEVRGGEEYSAHVLGDREQDFPFWQPPAARPDYA